MNAFCFSSSSSSVVRQRWSGGWRTSGWRLTWQNRVAAQTLTCSPPARLTTVSLSSAVNLLASSLLIHIHMLMVNSSILLWFKASKTNFSNLLTTYYPSIISSKYCRTVWEWERWTSWVTNTLYWGKWISSSHLQRRYFQSLSSSVDGFQHLMSSHICNVTWYVQT